MSAVWTPPSTWTTTAIYRGPGGNFVLKTMWNMPAKLLRESAANDDEAEVEQAVATGSLQEMIEAFDEYDDAASQGLFIKCAGRDRPITWLEVKDLRRS